MYLLEVFDFIFDVFEFQQYFSNWKTSVNAVTLENTINELEIYVAYVNKMLLKVIVSKKKKRFFKNTV